MKIRENIEAWWGSVKFRYHMRQRDKARMTAQYFLSKGHKDLANSMLLEALACEKRAKTAGRIDL